MSFLGLFLTYFPFHGFHGVFCDGIAFSRKIS